MSNQRRFALIGRGFGSDTFYQAVADVIGGILVDGSEINFTYDNSVPSISASLINASISFARLQNADAVSVLGRSANSSGVLDEIAASANDRILRRTSDTLNFGQLTSGMFPNTVVPDAALSSNVPLLDATQTWTGDNTFRGVTYLNPDPQTIPASSVNADARLVLVDNAAISIQQLAIGTSLSLGYRFVAAGGTFASPEAVATTNTNFIGFIGGGGYDGTNWQTGAAGLVGIRPTATWSDSQRPARVTFETTAQGSTTRTRRVFVDDNGELVAEFGVRLTGIISPTQLSANTDDWNPTNLANAAVIRATTDASRNLTGIVAPSSGRLLRLFNVGTQDLVLVHDATSTAANRFLLPNSANLTLNPNDSVTLWYDTTSSRWRACGASV